MTRSIYSTKVVRFVCVTDLNEAGARSVTNDIDNVIADLVEVGNLRCGDQLIYRDSEGRWDQVVLDDELHFVSFSPLHSPSRSCAIAKSMILSGGTD